MEKIFGFVVAILIFRAALGIEIEKELTLSFKEKLALDQFRGSVEHLLTDEYMKGDLYLIRWLRARNLNIGAAEEMLKANLKWRKDDKIDEILDEDWSQFASEFVLDDTGSDRTGRPVMAADISEWNVRDLVISGQGDKLVRYMIRGVESVSRRVRDLQSRGENVTQWHTLLNMDNFNLVQHGCLQCLPIYVRFILAHESYYPYGADKIISFNTPGVFEVVLRLVRPVMSQAMRDSLIVLGTNKNEWRKVILGLIAPDQLRRNFGGTKESYY